MDTDAALSEGRDYFAGKRVLITGGRGFIASHLARQLYEWDAHVLLLDRLAKYSGELDFICADVCDFEALNRATRGCDVLFHLAGLLGVEKVLGAPLDVLQVNLEGTINALKAAAQNDVERFVLSSSSEVYGQPQSLPINEDSAPSPISTYGVSKLAAESYCNAYAVNKKLDVTCLRYFNVYGPGQTEDFVIARFVSRVAKSEPPIVYGDGKQIRTYTFISDAINCTLLAASNPNAVNETFNVGSAETVSVSELARLVIEISGNDLSPVSKPFGDVGIRPAQREVYDRIPDTSKAETLLDFRSRVSIREGIAQCYDRYLAWTTVVP